jgi:hypothetical protein
VAVSPEDNVVVLQLQGLPYSGNHIKSNPNFNQDELAVVILAAFPVDMEAFNGNITAGPKPIFVSSKPDEALAALRNNEYAHRLCQALAGRLKTTEAMTGEQAVQIGPLPRIGKTTSPLVRAWILQEPETGGEREDPPPPKMPRGDQAGAGAATGAQDSLAGILLGKQKLLSNRLICKFSRTKVQQR